jgi:VanZ family protein
MILFIMLLPGSTIPNTQFTFDGMDLFIHTTLFFFLSLLFHYEYTLIGPQKPVYIAGLSAIVFLAFATEMLQFTVVAGRSGSVIDLLADHVGIAGGIIVGRRFK